MPLDTLSRLKGIETNNSFWIEYLRIFPVTLDTLSRLKGIETLPEQTHGSVQAMPLDTLSRLKGIETLPHQL